MKDVLYNEKNDFNEVTIKEDFIKLKKDDDVKVYYFDKIDLNNSFKTNAEDNFVEVNLMVDDDEVIFMIKKSNFLKFKEVLNPIKRSYLNQDFSLSDDSNKENIYNPREDDDASPIYAVVGFFIPLIGFIIWCILVNTKPKTAKMAGIASIIGFIFNLILYVIWLGPLLSEL